MFISNHEKNLVSIICAEIVRHNNFVLTTHQLPDGDGLSCELAFFCMLTRLGKKAVIVNDMPARAVFNFLPCFSRIMNPERYRQLKFNPEVAIVFDCSNRERVGNSLMAVSEARMLINIDHHEGNTLFGDINWISNTRSSVGEMCFFIVEKLRCLDRDTAECLYVAILTDTGSFRYHFDGRTLHIAEKLLKSGVDPETTADNLYHNNSISSLHLAGYALSHLQYDRENRVAWTVLTEDVYRKTGASEQDTEIIVDILRSIKDAEFVFLVRERKNEVKFSLRSRKGIDVRSIAEKFGGGGHNSAAGFSLQKMSAEQAVSKFLKYLRGRKQDEKK